MRRMRIVFYAFVAAVLGSSVPGRLTAADEEISFLPPARENGDSNGDQRLDVSDGIHLLSYLYRGGPEPAPLLCGRETSIWQNGDVNGDWERDVSDVVYLFGHLYGGGPAAIGVCDFAHALSEGSGAGQTDQSNPNPGILPPSSRPHGKSYGEWNAAWWNWAVSITRDRNPVTDTTGEFCAEGQSGPVWFLAGNFGGTMERSCTVPAGKTLFFPVLNTVAWVPRRGNTEEEVRAFALERMKSASLLDVTIDGLPVQEVASYLADSAAFTLVLPPNDVVGLGPASFFPAVAAGYSLMVTPFPPGEHTIHFAAASTFPGPFSLDITYHLTVEPADE